MNQHQRHTSFRHYCAIGLAWGLACAVQAQLSGANLHLGFENELEVLSDFVSQAERYRVMGRESLVQRELTVEPGRFGNALHIVNGWPISKNTWNESGLDCDLIVAVMWGEWHKKPHYWGAGAFHGNEGTVAFWVKSDKLEPGFVFMQGSIAWGRKERDLFAIEVDGDGRFSAFIRDIANRYHRVAAEQPTWKNGEWQHVAVTFDHAYGMKLFHNGIVVGSTWGQDAWWETTQPGLFSPFLPESFYDEICMFDVALEDAQVASLFETNTIGASASPPLPLPEDASERILAAYGDPGRQEVPTVSASAAPLHLKQTRVKECRDELIPAWWVMDGRYELAWPHPYRLFTFILGDADFHGERIELELEPGEQPQFISFEGILDDLNLMTGTPGEFGESNTLLPDSEEPSFFCSKRIDLAGATALRVPLVKSYGSPSDLQGSAKLPLSGDTRIHEIQLWEQLTPVSERKKGEDRTWYLLGEVPSTSIERYGPALNKLMAARDRRAVTAGLDLPDRTEIPLRPMESIHVLGPDLNEDMPVDAVRLGLSIVPSTLADHVRIRLRDPGNPGRIWAQTWVRVDYPATGSPQSLDISLDIIDLMLASEDRLWVELTFLAGGNLVVGDEASPSTLSVVKSADPKRTLEAYVKHEMVSGRVQYIKEYNYRPWRFTGEVISLQNWSNFGGPYDMAYSPLAVLRHAPEDRIANIYRELVLNRTWPGAADTGDVRTPVPVEDSGGAPAWAVWERELHRLNDTATQWIISRQRADGMFWGGSNDDCFIPLGYAGIPLLGNERARRSWLRYYEGLEEMGIFYDGYCDIWPIDPLHITDFIGSRGLMLAFALGDPYVVEREMRTSQRYSERIREVDAKRAEKGLPPLTGNAEDREKNGATLVEQVDAEIRNYSLTHLRAYWGLTPPPAPHQITDREDIARQMMHVVHATDEPALFALTEGMIHTDNQRGIGRDVLIASALGGRVQGRVEPYPIGIAVSWEGVDTVDLARLVSYADDKRLVVNLYNFTGKPVEATMRVWRLAAGRYSVRIGVDENDDGTIDAPKGNASAVLHDEVRDLRRFSTIPVTAAPRQNLAVVIEQVEAAAPMGPLPDLAIGTRDIRKDTDGAIHAVVHNIGAVTAGPFTVALVDKKGATLETVSVDALGDPSIDLAPQRFEVAFTQQGSSKGRAIILDENDLVLEILEENNRIEVNRPVESK
ncbi:MAG: LamG domain-containing protein [Candidatus Hydrogenedentes bacterium]|nr:LamG domain-containing protein [Candidatus Hydrogenedentota bacterium]